MTRAFTLQMHDLSTRRTFALQMHDRPKLFQGPLRPPMFNGQPITQEVYDALHSAFGPKP